MKTLRRDDGGSSLAVSVGDEVEIQLPENGTTGYTWQVAALPAGVEKTADDPVGPMSTQAGAGRDHRFRFTVTRPADGRLRLELRRFWEPESQPEDAFDVQLTPALPGAPTP